MNFYFVVFACVFILSQRFAAGFPFPYPKSELLTDVSLRFPFKKTAKNLY
ncbi:hypothetical protein OESDEN_07656 [Oesophagostomum dentatum]|uniref:Uncharacterized protein n=1 Tax=Oesophagostomum dentatum TaxID=61180 RepID=A0A0B1T9H1_OESDE|nr:hypothetical protein OESDEN_07656 [Oesophagostomum dentatum]